MCTLRCRHTRAHPSASLDKYIYFLRQLHTFQLDFTAGDDGFSTSSAKTPRPKAAVKTAQSNMQNFHVATLRALLELGQTALSLGEVDSAVEVFQRRLR